MFDGPDVGGGDELVQLFPAGADKTAFAARRFIAAGFCRILHDAIPCQHRVGMLRQGFAPQLNQSFTRQRVLQAVGAVEIPGVAGAARAAARFVIWQIRPGARIIGLLCFPGNEAVFDVNFPAAGAGAVHTVRGADNFVELPALTVAIFPVTVVVVDLAVAVGKGLALLLKVAKAIQKFTHDISPAPIMSGIVPPGRMSERTRKAG